MLDLKESDRLAYAQLANTAQRAARALADIQMNRQPNTKALRIFAGMLVPDRKASPVDRIFLAYHLIPFQHTVPLGAVARNRFYPAHQALSWGEKRHKQLLDLALRIEEGTDLLSFSAEAQELEGIARLATLYIATGDKLLFAQVINA